MNFYSFHIGDYASATRHLSWDEDMAYRRLMDAYYAREVPLPLDRKQIYRLVSAQSARHRAAVDVVLSEFFTETEAGFSNARCEEELVAFASKRDKASQSARKRWNTDGALPSHSERTAEAMPSHSEGNAPTTHYPLPSKESGSEERAPLIPPADSATLEAVQTAWNNLASETKIPAIQNFSDPRKAALRLRLKDIGGLDGFYVLCDKIRASPMLTGHNDRGWVASFDWVLKPANLTKIMEGNYDERAHPVKSRRITTGESLAATFGGGYGEGDAPAGDTGSGDGSHPGDRAGRL